MWFKNLQIYRLPKAWQHELAELEEALSKRILQACSASDAQSIGWVAPRPNGALVHSVQGQYLLTLGHEKKLLPASVVKYFADERTAAIEEAEGRRVGRKEQRELREAITAELLPRAFVSRRATNGWIDPKNGWLVIDAASPTKAEEFLEYLRKTVDKFPAKLLQSTQSPMSAMTGWIAANEAPAGFSIDQDLELRSSENATVRYAKHSLEGEEIRQHIADGKAVTRLAMTWNDRISFVLNDNLQLKRISFLDILKEQADAQAENEDERFELDFTLMTGEIARLLDDLLEALGGEFVKP